MAASLKKCNPDMCFAFIYLNSELKFQILFLDSRGCGGGLMGSSHFQHIVFSVWPN